MGTPWVALVLVVVIAACSVWVLRDAQVRASRGRPVVAVVVGYTIDEPGTWAVLCLVACVVFVPMYLAARGES